MEFRSLNRYFITLSLFCFSAVCISILMQYYAKKELCTLCSIQRFMYLAVGIVALLGFLTSEKQIYRYASVSFLIGLGIVSAYHLLVQNGTIPDFCTKHVPISTDQFEATLMDTKNITKGNECSQVSWKFLNLPISVYTLLFAFCFLVLMPQKKKTKKNNYQINHC